MASGNVEAARRGFAAMKRGDLAEIEALLDEEIRWHAGDPNAREACHNRRQALAYMQRADRPGPGELVDVVESSGDRVVVITQPPAQDGSPAELHAQITTFRNGKVVEMVGYPTVQAALHAAGVEWSP